MRLPPVLGTQPAFTRHEDVVLGLSGAAVRRLLDADGTPVAYVKTAGPEVPHLHAELRAEADRLVWLAGRDVTVPELLACATVDGTAWLVTRPLAGVPASDPWAAEERHEVVVRLAGALRSLHSADPSGCPFDHSPRAALRRARARTAAGLVDASWQALGKHDVSAAQALAELDSVMGQSEPEDLVVGHGDFCLPNVLLRPDGSTGLVDLGGAGLADRHADVAAMLSSLRNGELNPQYGEAYARLFLDAYGREGLSEERLRMHELLAPFFWPVPRRIDPADSGGA